jgi:teichuronic acid biosynthesis glycosyltransferase TuaH
VSLISNAVDVEHFRRPRPRPLDLPGAPVAVYVGTLHESRLDVDLVVAVARELPAVDVLLVGPDALKPRSRKALGDLDNVSLLGARPYDDVPAYLQHADVIIVPHRVTPFTDSLDPIKAYECIAVGTPTVATPVAGFRELHRFVTLAERESFTAAVEAAFAEPRPKTLQATPATWGDRAREFERVLLRVARRSR